MATETKSEIPVGFYYTPNHLTEEEHATFLKWLLEQEAAGKFTPVKGAGSREVLQFGVAYDYASKNISKVVVPPFPEEVEALLKRLKAYNFRQCLINRYLPGEGITVHIDSSVFGPDILCITIAGGCLLELSREDGDAHYARYAYYIEPKSAYMMTGDARYKWKHQKTARKSDMVGGKRVQRQKHFSVTFRTLV